MGLDHQRRHQQAAARLLALAASHGLVTRMRPKSRGGRLGFPGRPRRMSPRQPEGPAYDSDPTQSAAALCVACLWTPSRTGTAC